jgi:hypothetical protein
MRPLLITLAASLVLAACTTTPRTPDVPPFTLDGEGIAPTESGLRIDFGREQSGVIETVSRLLGEDPSLVSTIAECNGGPMTVARWRNGLALNFVEGDFRGWETTDPALPVAGRLAVDQPRVDMPSVTFQATASGDAFNVGSISGLLDPSASRIQQMWAGATCSER